jgi:hypothetical protein
VKELEEDITLVGGQRDALNIQVGTMSTCVRTLEDEVVTLRGRSMIGMRLFEHLIRHAGSCVTRSWAGRPILRVSFLLCSGLGVEVPGLR